MKIAVTSPSFCRHPRLREELAAAFADVRWRDDEGRLEGDALRAFLADADAAIVGLEPVDAALLAALPRLRAVAKYGVGLDNVDVEACRQRGVFVGWSGGVNARSVAEMTVCFMIGLCRNIFASSHRLKSGEWHKRGGVQLGGRTVGIIGVGHVGSDVLRLLAPFGCRVLANDIRDVSALCAEHGATAVDKATLFAEADVVSLHVPLTADTRHLIDRRTLAAMKPGAFLINTARGPVVEEAALKEALASGRLAGAAIDVFESEPPADREFLALPGLVPTPHIGGNAEEAVLAMGRSAIAHLCAYAAGARP